MKVAFWSNVAKKNAVTSNLAGISVMSSMMFKEKMILFENHNNDNNLEQAFIDMKYADLVHEEEYFFNHVGTDSLIRHIKVGLGGENLVKDASISLLDNNVYYIPHSNLLNKELFEYELSQVINALLRRLEKFCETTFIDTSSENILSSKIILEESELVVVNLSQNAIVLNEFFIKHKELAKKAIFILGNYENNLDYSKGKIAKKYDIDIRNIAVIPHNLEFKEALVNGQIIGFLYENYECKENDSNYYFISELKKATAMIYKRIKRFEEAIY